MNHGNETYMWNGWSDDGGAKTGKQEQTINK